MCTNPQQKIFYGPNVTQLNREKKEREKLNDRAKK